MAKLLPPGMINHIASGYSLHLYCKWDNPEHAWDEFPHEYDHEKQAVAWRSARKAGWIVHRDRTATCPKCAKQIKEPTNVR